MDPIVSLLVGVVVGIVLTGGGVLWLMRTKMVVAQRSARSFEQTCATVEGVVDRAQGWGFPIDNWDMYRTFADKDLVPDGFRKLRIYFVCNAGFASRLLSSVPGFVGMMPCTWAVYELEDGSVHLSKLNIGLMSRMFEGPVREVMGAVARADDEFVPVALGTN